MKSRKKIRKLVCNSILAAGWTAIGAAVVAHFLYYSLLDVEKL